MDPALDLDLVRTFLTVLEARGFKPAAQRLNKTPAAISMQIKRLETILGQRVLERSNQGISLTQAGEVLREKGQQLMSLNYELLGDMQGSDLKGRLSFGSPADYTPTVLKKVIPIFRKDFPGASPSIALEPSRILRPRIHSGALDMAIVAREPDQDEGYALWSEMVAWFGNSVSKDGTPRIGLLSTDCVLRDHTLSNLAGLRGGHVVTLESATVAALRDAVEARFCQALLPISVASGLERSTAMAGCKSLSITFALIAGAKFEEATIKRVVAKFTGAPDL